MRAASRLSWKFITSRLFQEDEKSGRLQLNGLQNTETILGFGSVAPLANFGRAWLNAGVHINRIAGGDSHYRDPRRSVAAGIVPSEVSRQGN